LLLLRYCQSIERRQGFGKPIVGCAVPASGRPLLLALEIWRPIEEASTSMIKPLVEIVKLGKRGELVLPRRVRSALGLSDGDELILTVEDKRVVMEHRRRGFGTYLDVMNPSDESQPLKEPAAPRERRGLGRFLPR
jgi:AbrB family looped-hinge helix DNA binding protein